MRCSIYWWLIECTALEAMREIICGTSCAPCKSWREWFTRIHQTGFTFHAFILDGTQRDESH